MGLVGIDGVPKFPIILFLRRIAQVENVEVMTQK
jgi:hypothetical protein